jgi:hypothetical protein
MRVTKYVKDYIEKEISDKYDPLIETIGEDNTKKHKLFQEEVKALTAEIEKNVDEIASKYGFKRDTSRWGTVRIDDHCYKNTEVEEEIREKKARLEQEKRKKISEIILKLEMGEATLKQLNSILREIHVGE